MGDIRITEVTHIPFKTTWMGRCKWCRLGPEKKYFPTQHQCIAYWKWHCTTEGHKASVRRAHQVSDEERLLAEIFDEPARSPASRSAEAAWRNKWYMTLVSAGHKTTAERVDRVETWSCRCGESGTSTNSDEAREHLRTASRAMGMEPRI